MNIASFVVVFIISFWLTLFMVLPLGVRRDDDPETGNDPGAPKKHMIGKKMLWSACSATILTFAYWYLVEVEGIRLFS